MEGSQELSDGLFFLSGKQFLIFSSAGKPIYSYQGSEETLSELMATAKALMSVAQSRSESLRYLRRGKHVIAFLDRSPLCLVAISPYAEPPPVLRMQLALLHAQIISLLTATALASVFTRSPGFDARKLLGGANIMLDALADSYTSNPAALLGAYPTMPMQRSVRAPTLHALKEAMKSSGGVGGCIFGLLVGSGCVIAAAAASPAASNRGRALSMQQWDVLLLLNFLQSNEGLRTAETFTPLCLPSFNPNGHLHAYIHYIDASTATALVLFVGSGSPEFFHSLSAARKGLVDSLSTVDGEGVGTLHAVLDACAVQGKEETCLTRLNALDAALGDAGLPPGSLLHFAYKLSRPQQFVASPMPRGIEYLKQEIVLAYSQVRAGMFDHAGEHVAGPLQTFRYEARTRFIVLAFSGADAELYLTFDPLVGKAEAVRAGARVQSWLQSRNSEWFFPPV